LTNQLDKQVLQDHEKRITELETNFGIIQNTQLRMESTLLNESRLQKDLLHKLIDQKFVLDKTQLKQTFDLDKINILKKWEFWIAAIGSGGILFFIAEKLFS
jgi:hypothetical protein